MLELLAAIQSVEPVAWPLVAVFLFSAAMYPLGLLMPCSYCCSPCEDCETGQLPDTITITFSGLEDYKVPGPFRSVLDFSSSWGSFGTSAAGYVNAPVDTPGPIGGITLTDGGSGYAVLGRVAPTLTITGGSGSGATFTPTLVENTNDLGFAYWSLDSVAVSGGTGYQDGDVLAISHDIQNGDVLSPQPGAAATLYLTRTEPTITISGNATATVTLAETGNQSWEVDSVTVTNGGSGYTEGTAITFSADGNDTTVTSATGTARVVHDEPDNPVITISTGGGSGAVLVPVWELLPENQWSAPNKKTYRLQSVTVTNGGSGYADYDLIDIDFASPSDGVVSQTAYIDADLVGGSGEILQVYVADVSDLNTPTAAGAYIGSRTDALHSVAVLTGGEYYELDPNSYNVVVTEGGSYFREDANEPPYVATVTVTVLQNAPDNGSGAQLTAVIDQNTASPTFGEITSVTINNAGDNYLAWILYPAACCSERNGAVVLSRMPVNPPITPSGVLGASSCFYYGWWRPQLESGNGTDFPFQFGAVCADGVTLSYSGPNEPPVIELMKGTNCFQTFTADSLVSDCSDFSFSATAISGATATVSPGGEFVDFYTTAYGTKCCPNQGVETGPPLEIEALYEDYGYNLFIEDYGWNPNGGNGTVVVGVRQGCGLGYTFPTYGQGIATTVSIRFLPCDNPNPYVEGDCFGSCGSGCETYIRADNPFDVADWSTSARCQCSQTTSCVPSGEYFLAFQYLDPDAPPGQPASWFGENRDTSNPPAPYTLLASAIRLTIPPP